MKILMSFVSLFLLTASVSFAQTASTGTATKTETKKCTSLEECAKKMGMTVEECKKLCSKEGQVNIEACAKEMGMTKAECKKVCTGTDSAMANQTATSSTEGATQVAAALVESELSKKGEVTTEKKACSAKKACCKKKS